MAVRQRDFIRVWSPETPRERLLIIADKVAAEYGVNREAMLGPRRYPELAAARFALYARLYAHGFTMTQIGRMTGRDHTTISYGIATHNGEYRKGRRRAA